MNLSCFSAIIALAPTRELAQERADRYVSEKYPEKDGWTDQQAVLQTDLEDIRFGNRRITYEIVED